MGEKVDYSLWRRGEGRKGDPVGKKWKKKGGGKGKSWGLSGSVRVLKNRLGIV